MSRNPAALSWFAIWTRSRHEQMVYQHFVLKEIEAVFDSPDTDEPELHMRTTIILNPRQRHAYLGLFASEED